MNRITPPAALNEYISTWKMLTNTKSPILVKVSKINRETAVDFMDRLDSSLCEYAGFFDARKSTLLMGLINAKKYKVFSMIRPIVTLDILFLSIFLSIYNFYGK